MSKDHPVSAQLLPDGAIVEGFPWLGGEPKALGLASLGVRCLCRTHNSALSDLDNAAGRLSRDLDKAFEVLSVRRLSASRVRTWSPHSWDQDGVLLERWCGKLICTTLAGGMYGELLPNWTPPLQLVEFIFGLRDLNHSAGLSFRRKQPGEWKKNDPMWGFTPIGPPESIEGAAITFRVMRIAFLPFVSTAAPPSSLDLDGVVEELMHHPRSIELGLGLRLSFRWTRRAGKRAATF